MVHALHEAHRVLTPSGVLLDVRPVVAPLLLEVIAAGHPVWSDAVHAYSAPDDIAAAEAAMRQAVASGWFALQTSICFQFDIYCDTAAGLQTYLEARKLCGADIPYDELEQRRLKMSADGKEARLRCRRPWMLKTYTHGRG